ncbi:MAG: GrpB family protein [Solirubrobacterales bacterium]
MRLIREEEIRERVGALFERHRTELLTLLPRARVEHIGSTAVPGSLTKGDLDLCVLVSAPAFGPATRTLAARHEIHQPDNWTPTFAGFTAPAEGGIDVGIQLAVAGSADERAFVGWRDRLRSDPSLRARYDEIKRRHHDDGADAYRAAKARLIEEALA